MTLDEAIKYAIRHYEEVADKCTKHKCKECIWFDGCWCTEPERNRINEEKGWNYYRNFRRMPSEPACKQFEEKENDIRKYQEDTEVYMIANAFSTLIKDMSQDKVYPVKLKKENDMKKVDNELISNCEKVLGVVDGTLDVLLNELEEDLDDTPEVDPRAPKNRYGIGETLYLPVTITGIRESVNGSDILYEVRTANGKRLGFKVFECASDIWRDKDHYMATIPESILMENFKEA